MFNTFHTYKNFIKKVIKKEHTDIYAPMFFYQETAPFNYCQILLKYKL